MPWWLYQEQAADRLDFPRGYHIEFGGGRGMPGSGIFGGLEDFTEGAYGLRFKEEARRYYGSFLYFDGRGEMIPNEDSYCEIDPDKKDRWGIPVAPVPLEVDRARDPTGSAHGQDLWPDHRGHGRAGGRPRAKRRRQRDRRAGRSSTRSARSGWGAIPKTAPLNHWCQAWDVKNLFVTDGAPFVSNADKNPTLSILALAWRTTDHIVDEMKRGNV